VVAGEDANTPNFRIVASGQGARITEDVGRTLRGEELAGPVDARGIQPQLTYRLARSVNAGLTVTAAEGTVEITAG
ncbi:MAG: histidine phosphotransferase family protein, partial [Rhizomicrobium sp.]